MDLETFITTIYCVCDDVLRGQKLRQRGFAPKLSDSEVLTMEFVGEFLGLDTDAAIYRHFRWHPAQLFPTLLDVHRTTFARQAANLWGAKWQLWRSLLGQLRSDPLISVVDSVPMPVCRFARAKRCRLFQGEAAYGRDSLLPGTFYGFRLHLRITWPGLISAFELTPGNAADIAVAPDLLENTFGWALGDRAYWSASWHEAERARGLHVLTPFQTRAKEKSPWPFWLVIKRRRIEVVIAQLVERFHNKRVRARDLWHLCSRLLRKITAHTLAVLLCQEHDLPDLQLARLVTA